MGKNKKKKQDKKAIKEKKFKSNVEERAKEAAKLEPPEKNEFKMDNEDNIDKFVKFRPKVREKYSSIKEKARYDK